MKENRELNGEADKSVQVAEEQKEGKCKAWIKKHKTGLIVAGVGAVSVAVALILRRKPEDVKEVFLKALDDASRAAPEMAAASEVAIVSTDILADSIGPVARKLPSPYEVGLFVRNLPEGAHRSAAKTQEALELGLGLLETQTIVDAHPRAVCRLAEIQ